jgi:hypothetical protein
MVLMVGAALTAGWLSVLSAETGYIDQFDNGVQRRIAFNNGSALAQTYLLEYVVTKTSATSKTASLSGGWGSVTIPATASAPLASTTPATGWNHFNSANGEGYTSDLSVSIGDGIETTTRRYEVRSRSPLLGGDLLIAAYPGPNGEGEIKGPAAVAGRVLYWTPGSGLLSVRNDVQTQSFTMMPNPSPIPSPTPTLQDTSSQNLLVSNFAFPPLTSGDFEGTPSYDGKLDVVANASGLNSLAVAAATYGSQSVDGSVVSNSSGVTSDGNGLVTIDLDDPLLLNVVVNGNTNHLILEGQTTAAESTAAGDLGAVSVIVVQADTSTRDLTTVDFTGSNNRRLVFAIKKELAYQGGPSDWTVFNFPDAAAGSWRLLTTLENAGSLWQASGASLTVFGGIQTNRATQLHYGSDSITFQLEPDPKLLDRLTARDAWVESYDE